MVILNFVIGATGLVLAGHSFGKAQFDNASGAAVVGVAELVAGIYFSVSAIGGIS